MKVSKFKQIIENAVKKAVKEEMKSFLNEIAKPSDDDIIDGITDQSGNQLIENENIKEQKFAANSTLNRMLNETYIQNEWKDVNGEGGLTSKNAMSFDKNGVTQSIPTNDIDGRPVDVESLPDGVKNMFTKDYSKILKKSKERSLSK